MGISVTINAGPDSFSRAARAVLNIEKAGKPYSGDIGIYTEPEFENQVIEGSTRWKNAFGYNETCEGTGSYSQDKTAEVGIGIYCPRLKVFPAAFVLRTFLSQNLKRSFHEKERLIGLSAGVRSSDNTHDLRYDITCQALIDQSYRIRYFLWRKLNQILFSALSYTFNINKRDSSLRPRKGYALKSNTQISGIAPEGVLARIIRQILEFRYAIPLPFLNTALNIGLAAGLIVPWGRNFLSEPIPLSSRFFMGGQSSLYDLGGPTTLLGFRRQGIQPSKVTTMEGHGDSSKVKDGGDFAITAFADFSFDIPLRILKQYDIHGHIFICLGNLIGEIGSDFQSFSLRKFLSTFRCSAGVGIILPTKQFLLEANAPFTVRQLKYDSSDREFHLALTS